MGRGPGLDLAGKVVREDFGERLAPVMADFGGLHPGIRDQCGKVGREIVAPAPLEFIEEVGSPIGVENLEAVAEYGCRHIRSQRGQLRLGDFADEFLDGCGVVVVGDVALRAHGRPLDLHSGVACDEEYDRCGTLDGLGQPGQPVPDLHLLVKGPVSVGHCVGARRRTHECGHQFFARLEGGEGDACFAALSHRIENPKSPGTFRGREHRPAIGPAAAKSEVHPHSLRLRLLRRELEQIEKLRRKERNVLEAGYLTVERQGIDRLDLEPADAAGLHRPDLARDFGLRDSRAKPPPPHHDSGIVRGRVE